MRNEGKRDYGFFAPFFAFAESAIRVESAFFTESAMRVESAIFIESLIAGVADGAIAGGVAESVFAASSPFEQAASATTAATRAKRFIVLSPKRVRLCEQRWSVDAIQVLVACLT